MAEKILAALGGHAMVRPGQRGTIEEQRDNLERALAGVVELIRRGHALVITHGNGPQVGQILLRAEEARGKAYELPLHICVAQSQGEIGYLIQQCLRAMLQRSGISKAVSVVLTCAVVDPRDARMTSPTKPVGPFYPEEKAPLLREKGWNIMEDAHRGYRRVVASPVPLCVPEAEVIRRLFESGVVVVAAGGGGIPVRVGEGGEMVGVDAVVDKDLTSSILASAIEVERIIDLTAVERVKLDFGSARESDIPSMTVREAKSYLAQGHFAPGSMGPKIEGAVQFLERGGREVIITLPEKTLAAFDGKAGTHLYPD